ncbi:MAG: sigma 54-interacting transcriptional regulator [Candidatus Schekmanbacteria bacterium]|nr:sigma 54-interacting transcriptional regulator [Candidatus Schekmanbacteria bacterium]
MKEWTSSDRHHLRMLRELLRRDHLTGASWSYALRDLAAMVGEALNASEAMVALYSGSERGWSAWARNGDRVEQRDIARHGSLSVLERVRETSEPVLLTRMADGDLASESILRHRVTSVLAVPIWFWDVAEDRPTRYVGGCLYVHRSDDVPPFSESDIDLVVDLTEISQRTLNVLRHLSEVKSDLEEARYELRELRRAAADRFALGKFETQEPWFARHVIATLARISHADKVGIMILGPTGSGKSFLAQAYHYECPRRTGPFVVFDCSQVTSSETLAAELFGYAERSGFANAPEKGRHGAAQRAHRGTLFIDEVGLLPPELQARLLSLIQTGSFAPLGQSERAQVDVQIIAATNEHLEALVRQGRFREDLYWRLGEVVIRLPHLNERAADIPLLAEKFLRSACQRFRRDDIAGLSDAAVRVLVRQDWSRMGNVRGLEHTLNRAVLLAPAGATRLDASDLQLSALSLAPPPESAQTAPRQLDAEQGELSSRELSSLLAAIRETGSGTAAAKRLGISRGVLVWQLRKAGLTIRELLRDSSAS